VTALLVGLTACLSTTEPVARIAAPVEASFSRDGGSCILANGNTASTGYDIFGYNRCASTFRGIADGVDKVFDGLINGGSPEFAHDHLVMNWNAEWDRGNAENWSKPPYSAWLNNEWNGKVPGGSGYSEHFKTRWYGPCHDNDMLPGGGICIWGQFYVLMDQGTVPGVGHVWWTKAIPNGYGH